MKLYTANNIIDNKNKFHGQRLFIEGVLQFEFENVSLIHWPKSERGIKSIWLEESKGPLKFNNSGLEKLSGKKVVVLGEFQSILPPNHENFYHGFGHMGMWSAQIIVTEIQYYKRWHEANGTAEI